MRIWGAEAFRRGAEIEHLDLRRWWSVAQSGRQLRESAT